MAEKQVDLSATFLAQGWHATAGALLVVWSFVLLGTMWALVVTLGIYLYLIPKEFWWDLKYEKDQTVVIGLQDIGYWSGGVALAWLSLWIFGRL